MAFSIDIIYPPTSANPNYDPTLDEDALIINPDASVWAYNYDIEKWVVLLSDDMNSSPFTVNKNDKIGYDYPVVEVIE